MRMELYDQASAEAGCTVSESDFGMPRLFAYSDPSFYRGGWGRFILLIAHKRTRVSKSCRCVRGV